MNFIKIVNLILNCGMTTTAAGQTKEPIKHAIFSVLTNRFEPVHLEVINESYMHNVPKGAETHFKVLIVSKKFNDLSLIKRHRLVYEAVKSQLQESFVHALSIEAKTPQQWDPDIKIKPSPKCLGGFGR